jgi:predicted transposase/invertase (TIGR01784 family)
MHKVHDHSYKLLFSEPQIVIDLLEGFVHESWVNKLDFTTLEKVPTSFITDDLRVREDDIIWRVKQKDTWVYIYLLIEFQSTIDPFMAVRVPLYTLLLYQDLIKTKQITKNKLLPPVFPVVLYNGSKRWDSPTQLSDLIVDLPGGLEKYKPSFEYLLLDEGNYPLSELEPLTNFVAAIFRLENSKTPEDINHVISNLIDWLRSPEQESIRRSFTVWIKRGLLSTHKSHQSLERINELTEIRVMLAGKMEQWEKEWSQQAIMQGLEKGLEQGLEQGLEHEKTLLYRLIERRYGKHSLKKSRLIIQSISTVKVLEQIGDWIIDCETGQDFLNKLEALS